MASDLLAGFPHSSHEGSGSGTGTGFVLANRAQACEQNTFALDCPLLA